jgi:hypothetical protein
MAIYEDLCYVLNFHGTSLCNVVCNLLDEHNTVAGAFTVLQSDLLFSHSEVLYKFWQHPLARPYFLQVVQATYQDELLQLVNVKNGWHFGAVHANTEQINNFRIEDMQARMKVIAPGLYTLLDFLVHSRHSTLYKDRENSATASAFSNVNNEDGILDENSIFNSHRSQNAEQRAAVNPKVADYRQEAIRGIVCRVIHNLKMRILVIKFLC